MLAYIVRRVFLGLFTLLIVSYISFMIVQLPPGDQVDAYLQMMHERGFGEAPNRTEFQVEALREAWGLNRPAIVQWWDWLSGILVRGDFGYSYAHIDGGSGGRDIRTAIAEDLPFTIYLSIFTILITWVFAIPVGIYSAVRQNSVGDYVFTLAGFAGLAVPDFLLGLVAMYVAFAYFDHSVGGIFSGEYITAPWSVGRVIDMLQHLIIPGLVLGTAGTAGLIRIMRNNLLDELRKPYVVTAQAKGLASWRVVLKYPVRVALNPFISGIGGMLPSLVSGSVIVSIVLSLNTIGPLYLIAIQRQDAQMAGAIILMLTSLSVVGVLISDLLLVVVDPRIKLTGSARGGGGTV